MIRVALAALLLALVGVACAACGGSSDEPVDEADLAAAREFDRYPLFWVGETFEGLDLVHVDLVNPNFVSLIYGSCEIDDPDGPFGPEGGSCSPPLQLQIQPLCAHLAVVANAPIWKRRSVRGAPVGTIDSAPVVFTSGAQVKVYRGQGSDPGLPMRALRALRSLNRVPPLVGADDPLPAAPRAVLALETPCRN